MRSKESLCARLRRAGLSVTPCDDHLVVSFGPLSADLWPKRAQWRVRGVGKPRLGIRNLIRELKGKPCSTID